MPHSMMLFSAKPENYTSPDFPPRKKGREMKQNIYPLPIPTPILFLSPFFPECEKREKGGEKESTPKNGGERETNRCIFIPAFEPKPNLFLEWLFSFPLVRELRVRTRKKRVNLFRGGALLNFDIKPSKRIREGFWK